ncbi:MAG: hypothetical protein K2O18_17625, partial [Oscillospiraceae bacterium]|nr:hypothetical protein [Oscillospiraceae bacterium]
WTDNKDLMALLTHLGGKDCTTKYYGKSLELTSGSFLIFKAVLSILIFYSLSFPPLRLRA